VVTTDVPGHGLDKYVWTDADFDRMGWHDCYIHGFHSGLRPERGEYDFLIDLDYIVRCVQPVPGDPRLSFWIAPATLVFHSANEITIEYGPSDGEMQIDRLVRDDERLTPNGLVTDYHWDFWSAGISLWATGFTQYIRREPVLMRKQRLELEERGGVSFAKGREDEATGA
jgi:hypothetical protein